MMIRIDANDTSALPPDHSEYANVVSQADACLTRSDNVIVDLPACSQFSHSVSTSRTRETWSGRHGPVA